MTYQLKIGEEILWVIAQAGGAVLLQAVVDFNPEGDIKKWAMLAAVTGFRQIAVALLALLGRVATSRANGGT